MPDFLSIQVSSSSQLRIGLIVRGKMSHTHAPGKLEQHADCILPSGAPVGFFGEGNNNSGNRFGLRMQGTVYDFAQFEIERPFYVDRAKALANRVVSTVLLINVDNTAASRFRRAWASMAQDPGDFNIIGGNCSTNASAAFIRAKIVEKQIPGIDTPDSLYHQLYKAAPGKCTAITVFIGFVIKSGQPGYTLEVTPYVDATTSNRPNPGSSISA